MVRRTVRSRSSRRPRWTSPPAAPRRPWPAAPLRLRRCRPAAGSPRSTTAQGFSGRWPRARSVPAAGRPCRASSPEPARGRARNRPPVSSSAPGARRSPDRRRPPRPRRGSARASTARPLGGQQFLDALAVFRLIDRLKAPADSLARHGPDEVRAARQGSAQAPQPPTATGGDSAIRSHTASITSRRPRRRPECRAASQSFHPYEAPPSGLSLPK